MGMPPCVLSSYLLRDPLNLPGVKGPNEPGPIADHLCLSSLLPETAFPPACHCQELSSHVPDQTPASGFLVLCSYYPHLGFW